MAVNCTRQCKTKGTKYHHNIAMAAVFDNICGRLYFVAKTLQAGAKGAGILPLSILKHSLSR